MTPDLIKKIKDLKNFCYFQFFFSAALIIFGFYFLNYANDLSDSTHELTPKYKQLSLLVRNGGVNDQNKDFVADTIENGHEASIKLSRQYISYSNAIIVFGIYLIFHPIATLIVLSRIKNESETKNIK